MLRFRISHRFPLFARDQDPLSASNVFYSLLCLIDSGIIACIVGSTMEIYSDPHPFVLYSYRTNFHATNATKAMAWYSKDTNVFHFKEISLTRSRSLDVFPPSVRRSKSSKSTRRRLTNSGDLLNGYKNAISGSIRIRTKADLMANIDKRPHQRGVSCARKIRGLFPEIYRLHGNYFR